MNPLLDLKKQGQSVWLDYIRRSFLTGGGFQRLIEEDGIRGVASNPVIFEKAIDGSRDLMTRSAVSSRKRPVPMPVRSTMSWESRMFERRPIFCGRHTISAAAVTAS